jgi:two-component system response regulator EvgA
MVRSVLVVDDDVSFRELAARLLRAWGHNVVGEAGTVADALTQAAELRPDTVLADIALPDGDGYQLTGHLLALLTPIRVVLISADSHPGMGPAAHRAGAQGFLPKDELSEIVLRELLEGP